MALLFITRCLIILIKLYRLLISPMIGPCCRFYPTCSIYGMEVLQKFGLFNGLWLLIKRLLKCNSMSVGGYDPIPLYKIKKYHKRENN